VVAAVGVADEENVVAMSDDATHSLGTGATNKPPTLCEWVPELVGESDEGFHESTIADEGERCWLCTAIWNI
jgi:hypothetical protein